MADQLEIISGGQTGVDRGALDAALELGTACGGWCPEGRQAEDGAIPDCYPVEVRAGAGYPERTRRNVQGSDGTLILHFGPLSAGTLFTLKACEDLLKPVCLIDGGDARIADAVGRAQEFVDAPDLRRLNVAGPRASHWANAHDYSRDVIRGLLLALPTSH